MCVKRKYVIMYTTYFRVIGPMKVSSAEMNLWRIRNFRGVDILTPDSGVIAIPDSPVNIFKKINIYLNYL